MANSAARSPDRDADRQRGYR